jgi:branched-subunit amino acid transport protein
LSIVHIHIVFKVLNAGKMTSGEFGLIILGMGLVTYIPRWFPLFFLSRRSLPKWFVQWLDLVPAAILGALLLPELIVTSQPRYIDWQRPECIAAVPTFIIAVISRSLGWTVIAGMISYGLIQQWMV